MLYCRINRYPQYRAKSRGFSLSPFSSWSWDPIIFTFSFSSSSLSFSFFVLLPAKRNNDMKWISYLKWMELRFILFKCVAGMSRLIICWFHATVTTGNHHLKRSHRNSFGFIFVVVGSGKSWLISHFEMSLLLCTISAWQVDELKLGFFLSVLSNGSGGDFWLLTVFLSFIPSQWREESRSMQPTSSQSTRPAQLVQLCPSHAVGNTQSLHETTQLSQDSGNREREKEEETKY